MAPPAPIDSLTMSHLSQFGRYRQVKRSRSTLKPLVTYCRTDPYIAFMAAVDPMSNLNSAQRRAATFGDPLPDRKGVRAGPLLVVAGAGTGKTNTVAHRVAHLVTHGVDPARILLLTFTRRAAQEMRRRAHDIVREALDDTLGTRRRRCCSAWSGPAPSTRSATGCCATTRATSGSTPASPSSIAAIRPTCSTRCARSWGSPSSSSAFPRKDTCLAIYSWRVNTQKSLHETLEQQFPWCLGWEAELAKLCRAYVQRKQQLRAARLRRPAALLARA